MCERGNRRAGVAPGRLLRLWTLVAVMLALAAVASACGGGEAPTSPATTETASPSDPPSRPATGEQDPPLPALALEQVGEFEQPVFVTTAPTDVDPLYVVEKTGRVRVVRRGRILAEPFLDVSDTISSDGERGLLSIAFHPRFPKVDSVFTFSTAGDGALTIDRYRVSADGLTARAETRDTLLSIPHPLTNHNGGQLAFGPDGLLYAGTGDGGGAGDPERDALDPDSLLGKILTLNVDRETPRPAVYALGVRNPWRFSFDRQMGDLWIGDVGQDEREEIDFVRAGRSPVINLGWPAYEGTLEYDPQGLAREGLVFPVHEYGRDAGVSVTGGYVYRGTALRDLLGVYLFADYGSGRVWGMRGPRGAPEELDLGTSVTSPVSFGQDGDGELYLVSLDGPVYRLVGR